MTDCQNSLELAAPQGQLECIGAPEGIEDSNFWAFQSLIEGSCSAIWGDPTLGDSSLYNSFARPGLASSVSFFRTLDYAVPTGSCPVGGGPTPCPAIYAPILCGEEGCPYDNDCIAEAAGYNATKDCSPSTPGSSCPVGGITACPFIYAPIVCGEEDCPYDNDCLAENAGYNVAVDCTPASVPVPDPAAVPPVASSCPGPNGEVPCTFDLQPVVCGEDECTYDNQCLASASGYAEDDCVSTLDNTPVGTDCPVGTAPCSKIYQPILCGGCKYNNFCLANAAGWELADCVAALPMARDSASSDGVVGAFFSYDKIKVLVLLVSAAGWPFLFM